MAWCRISFQSCWKTMMTQLSLLRSYETTLQWRQNGRDSVSNHQPHDCFSTVYLDTDQRKHQSSASLAFVRGFHRRPVNSPHKWPVTRKMFPFDDVIMMKTKTLKGNSHKFVLLFKKTPLKWYHRWQCDDSFCLICRVVTPRAPFTLML